MGGCTGMGVPLMPPRAREKFIHFPGERQRKPCCSSGPEAPGTLHGPLPNHVQSSFLYLLLCYSTLQYGTVQYSMHDGNAQGTRVSSQPGIRDPPIQGPGTRSGRKRRTGGSQVHNNPNAQVFPVCTGLLLYSLLELLYHYFYH